MNRDPAFIAATLRDLRARLGITQESLAMEAGVSTRTVEKAESGRHAPDVQTLRSFARALGVDPQTFDKPEVDPVDPATLSAALRKVAVVQMAPILDVNVVVAALESHHAMRFDMGEVVGDEAQDVVAELGDDLRDLGDIWPDLNLSQRLRAARGVVEIADRLRDLGFTAFVGNHCQELRQPSRPPLRFDVLVVTARAHPEKHVALIHLEGDWQTVEADRIEVPATG